MKTAKRKMGKRKTRRGGSGFFSMFGTAKPEGTTATSNPLPPSITTDIQNYVNQEIKKLREELNKTIDTKLNGKANKTLVQA